MSEATLSYKHSIDDQFDGRVVRGDVTHKRHTIRIRFSQGCRVGSEMKESLSTALSAVKKP